MFERVNDRAGTTATLHSLRHTAAYRMAEDPALPLTDVQFVLGHALLTTTQICLTPRKEDVVRRVHPAQQLACGIMRGRPNLGRIVRRQNHPPSTTSAVGGSRLSAHSPTTPFQ